MQQPHQSKSLQNTSSDKWSQKANGLWLSKHTALQTKQKSQQQIAWTQTQLQPQTQTQVQPQTQTQVQPQTQTQVHHTTWIQQQFAGKTMWDWISLLLIPVLIAAGTVWVTNTLSAQQFTQSQQAAQEARWDDLLNQYRNDIDTLILNNGLEESSSSPYVSLNSIDVSDIAHARTLNILNTVDASRRGSVILYLASLYLTNKISLSGANLSGANLSNTNLSNTDFSGANLSNANFSYTDLSHTILHRSQLLNVFSLSGTIIPNGVTCKTVSDAEEFNEKIQAKNRDTCLAQWRSS